MKKMPEAVGLGKHSAKKRGREELAKAGAKGGRAGKGKPKKRGPKSG